MLKIGAHVSSAGGVSQSFERAKTIGADCFQIFISPPQMWLKITPKEEEVKKFKIFSRETRLGPNFIHGCYLMNFGADNPIHLQRSIDWLIYSQKTASKLGISGTIFHLGSHKGRGFETIREQIVSGLVQVLKQSPPESKLFLETSAGMGGSIGNFSEIGQLIKAVNDRRVKVCLDTAHVFAGGHEIRTAAGLKNTLAQFDQDIGLSLLEVIHCNDSKVDLGEGKDRHENIGEGFVGFDGFKNILNNPQLASLPFILEVPGFENKGPDKPNVDRLRALVSK